MRLLLPGLACSRLPTHAPSRMLCSNCCANPWQRPYNPTRPRNFQQETSNPVSKCETKVGQASSLSLSIKSPKLLTAAGARPIGVPRFADDLDFERGFRSNSDHFLRMRSPPFQASLDH